MSRLAIALDDDLRRTLIEAAALPCRSLTSIVQESLRLRGIQDQASMSALPAQTPVRACKLPRRRQLRRQLSDHGLFANKYVCSFHRPPGGRDRQFGSQSCLNIHSSTFDHGEFRGLSPSAPPHDAVRDASSGRSFSQDLGRQRKDRKSLCQHGSPRGQ